MKIIHIVILLSLLIACSVYAAEDLSGYTGTIYFDCDFESGYQYLDAGNAHSGSGYFSSLGGAVTMPEGSGCDNTDSYHNTIISSDSAGQGAVSGSTHSLKTPYDGSCPGGSMGDTTTVMITPVYEYYIRWYQKFTGDWPSQTTGEQQHKFFKVNCSGSWHDQLWPGQWSFPGAIRHAYAYMPNIDGHFNKNGCTFASTVWVAQAYSGSCYNGSAYTNDDINNGVGAGNTDANFDFQNDTWYCIEIHVKINSSSSTSDGEMDVWVDGNKIFGASGFKWYNSGTRPQVNQFEMQHIYGTRSSNDQPTYVDNLVIGSSYIGPLGDDDAPAPPTLSFYLTNPSGSGAAQGSPHNSLGGYRSTTQVSASAMKNLFDDVTVAESIDGDTEYRFLDVYNSGDSSATKVQVFVSSDTTSSGTEITLGYNSTNQPHEDSWNGEAVANEDTAPASPSLTFGTYTRASPLHLGTIPAGRSVRICVKRTVTAGVPWTARDVGTIAVRYLGD